MTLLDTHVVVWLYAGLTERLPPAVQQRLRGAALRLSPVAVLELAYLHEIGRLADPPAAVLADLNARLGLAVADASLSDVAAAAVELTWTRDPFDRLIAAHALVAAAPLVTADAVLRENLPNAVWA